MSHPTSPSLTDRMAAAARELGGRPDSQQTLDLAAQLAVTNIHGCDAAGISIVRRDRSIETPAATDPMAVEGDRLQYETREGPCLDSIWEQEITYSPSLAHDARWPTWGPLVVERTQAQSILSFRLFTSEDTLGALNLYSRTRDAFDEGDREDGSALAAHVAVAVAARTRITNLTVAMDTRSVIGQAMGVLMERFDLSPDRALGVLTRVSQSEEMRIRDVAIELVETRRLRGTSSP